jgi:hypothetical protein
MNSVGSRFFGLRRAAALAAAAAGITACFARPPAPPAEVIAVRAATLPATAGDAAWRQAPVYTAALIPQDMVEPRLVRATTGFVRVQAMTDGDRIAFRLAWTDSTRDELPGASRFTDACAVQLPQQPGPDVPAPQMGEVGKSVEITYWSAAWQAQVNGRPDSIQALYPNASVDHYPFDAPSLPRGSAEQIAMRKRYAPAQAIDRIEHPPSQPVQDLIAAGPGTLTPVPETRATGDGRFERNTWNVIVTRPLPAAMRDAARSQVAFAVWNGSGQEVGARKMRSVWIPLSLTETVAEAKP